MPTSSGTAACPKPLDTSVTTSVEKISSPSAHVFGSSSCGTGGTRSPRPFRFRKMSYGTREFVKSPRATRSGCTRRLIRSAPDTPRGAASSERVEIPIRTEAGFPLSAVCQSGTSRVTSTSTYPADTRMSSDRVSPAVSVTSAVT